MLAWIADLSFWLWCRTLWVIFAQRFGSSLENKSTIWNTSSELKFPVRCLLISICTSALVELVTLKSGYEHQRFWWECGDIASSYFPRSYLNFRVRKSRPEHHPLGMVVIDGATQWLCGLRENKIIVRALAMGRLKLTYTLVLYNIRSRSAQMVGELVMEWHDKFICEQKQDTQHESKRYSTKIEI